MIQQPPRNYNRRDALRLGAAAALTPLFSRWAAAADDAKASDAFTFIVANDIHYFDKRCAQWLADRVIKRMNDQKPDFCVILGDMSEDGTKEQNAAVHDVLKGLKMPLYVCVGNHDHQAGNDDRKPFEDHFPKSINYLFEHRGWQFVTVDSTQGHAGSKTAIHKDSLTFTAEALKTLDKKRPTALLTHFPMGNFLPNRPTNANDLLVAFAEHNLQAVFNGHFHSKTERAWGDATVTTNTCCSFHRQNHDFDPRKGYFLCTAKDGKVSREYIQVNSPM
ncbi:MAG: metallophosphoesterase [Phycisphaerales bacterium]|nr:metallophosphoesterase [Phycisphaerales bacterium]